LAAHTHHSPSRWGGGKNNTRLLELAAAANVAELSAGDPHEYSGGRKGIYSLDLSKGGRLLFRPDYKEPPKTPAGNIDWEKVAKVVRML